MRLDPACALRRIDMRARNIAVHVAVLLTVACSPLSAQEIERGRSVYKLCEACHSVVPGEHRFGPSLAGVLGRPAGRLKGYQFSDELAATKLRWTAANLTQ